MDLNDYLESHTTPPSPQLQDLYRHTQLTSLYPRMCTDHTQGRILAMLSRLIRPRRVLEIGAFRGYSALCLAEGLHPLGELHSIEIDDEAAPGIQAAFDASPHASQMHLHTGDALDLIPRLSHQPWDLVLIDANKRQYPEYLNLLRPLIAPGGYLLADNTLWDGKPYAEPIPSDPQTQGVARFNDLLAADNTFDTVILPIRDGLTVARKL